ncbi:MAG TPA: hypothetical protein VK083_03330 [Nocardia sp.]|uniref:hypothetical protein n=1 Tax=Nocardia sp. TaxID=1821 RepID=UPI002B4B10CE|nr:hypothetical protein [Nocardia sp.]HLS75811.1 hypothetical protein [Nocardia sp.]
MKLHRKYVTLLAAGALVTGAALTGCSDDDSGTDTTTVTVPSVEVTTTETEPTTETEETPVISPEAAQQLCDMMGADIDTWRDQGSTVAKVTFNGTVQNWAARNEGLNDDVIRDKGIVDEVTSQTCPDVRQQALEVLEVSELADALLGFDN